VLRHAKKPPGKERCSSKSNPENPKILKILIQTRNTGSLSSLTQGLPKNHQVTLQKRAGAKFIVLFGVYNQTWLKI
jgi:hypothetical protein